MKISDLGPIRLKIGRRGLIAKTQIAKLTCMKTKPNSCRVFKTKWGWFGLLAGDNGLVRTCLPLENKDQVSRYLLAGIEGAVEDESAFISIENAIMDYYDGKKADFTAVEVDLRAFTPFQRSVLSALQSVTYGNQVTYGQLAGAVGSPKAARAIGGCMAKNPLPLIVPCHRVTGASGQMTGFSGPGGIETKRRMLQLEGLSDLT